MLLAPVGPNNFECLGNSLEELWFIAAFPKWSHIRDTLSSACSSQQWNFNLLVPLRKQKNANEGGIVLGDALPSACSFQRWNLPLLVPPQHRKTAKDKTQLILRAEARPVQN